MALNFATDPTVAVGGDLDADATNYSETPLEGITLRWTVAAGPTDDLRVLTLRVVNLHAQQYRQTDLTTIIRSGGGGGGGGGRRRRRRRRWRRR